jgi:hypothetical protein
MEDGKAGTLIIFLDYFLLKLIIKVSSTQNGLVAKKLAALPAG